MIYPQLLRTALEQGLSQDRALDVLRSNGASPVEAALAVQAVLGVSLDEARLAVARSRAWAGPRSRLLPDAAAREWCGAIGQHGRSGHGASSVLPHLVRQAQAQVHHRQARR